MAKKKENIEEPLEKQLWKAADKLRKNIDAAEYKHVVLGLIFLKYISVSFEELYTKLQAEIEMGADPEDREEYKAENVFYVPLEARWSSLVANARSPKIGKFIDEAMDAIEKDNPILKGVLPKVFARPNLDPTSLGELIDLIGNSTLNTNTKSADLLGHVFEYFLGEFALAEVRQNSERKKVAEGETNEDKNKTKKAAPKRVSKIGRNDKCPCGSGKKYKKLSF